MREGQVCSFDELCREGNKGRRRNVVWYPPVMPSSPAVITSHLLAFSDVCKTYLLLYIAYFSIVVSCKMENLKDNLFVACSKCRKEITRRKLSHSTLCVSQKVHGDSHWEEEGENPPGVREKWEIQNGELEFRLHAQTICLWQVISRYPEIT